MIACYRSSATTSRCDATPIVEVKRRSRGQFVAAASRVCVRGALVAVVVAAALPNGAVGFAPGTQQSSVPARSSAGSVGGTYYPPASHAPGPAAAAASALGGDRGFLGDDAARTIIASLPRLSDAEDAALRAGRAVQRCARRGRRGDGLVVVDVPAAAADVLERLEDVRGLPAIIPSVRSVTVSRGSTRRDRHNLANGESQRAVAELSKLRLRVPFVQRRYGAESSGGGNGEQVVAFRLDKDEVGRAPGAPFGLPAPPMPFGLPRPPLPPSPFAVAGMLARAGGAGEAGAVAAGGVLGVLGAQCLDEAFGFWCVEPLTSGSGADGESWTRVWLSVSAVVSSVLPPPTIDYIAERALPRATEWLRPEGRRPIGGHSQFVN